MAMIGICHTLPQKGRKQIILLVITIGLLFSSYHVQAQYDTVQVFFEINASNLNKSQLDVLAKNFLQQSRDKSLLLFGYADYLGSEKGNDALARNRIATVKSWLISNGIEPTKIMLESAVGTVNYEGQKTDEGRPYDRRVDIFIKRPNTSSSTAVSAPAAQANLEAQIGFLKTNESLALPDILFWGGTPRLLEESVPALKELLEALKKFPDKKFSIEGHICCQYGIEGDGFNFDEELPNLSFARARTIYQYLIDHGIDRSILRYKGLGSKYPKIHPEKSDEDRKKNRRVEIRVID